MRTPAGIECPFYFADFHRGRQVQICRLIERTPGGGKYTPNLCWRCKAPRILMANGCPNLFLEARARSGLLGLGQRVEISAYCLLSQQNVSQPEVGCGHCHDSLSRIADSEEKA